MQGVSWEIDAAAGEWHQQRTRRLHGAAQLRLQQLSAVGTALARSRSEGAAAAALCHGSVAVVAAVEVVQLVAAMEWEVPRHLRRRRTAAPVEKAVCAER